MWQALEQSRHINVVSTGMGAIPFPTPKIFRRNMMDKHDQKSGQQGQQQGQNPKPVQGGQQQQGQNPKPGQGGQQQQGNPKPGQGGQHQQGGSQNPQR
jgi:hypothetical protein